MNLHLSVHAVAALAAGILILAVPKSFRLIVAGYLIFVGLWGIIR